MGRLLTTLTTVLRIFTGLIVSLFALPIFGIWRLLLLLLFSIQEILKLLHIPTIAIYPLAYSYFSHCWQHFLKLRAPALVIKHWIRITALTLFIISTGLSFTIFVKSSMLFLPWLLNPKSKSNSYSHSHHKHKHNPRTGTGILFYTTLYIATCAPLSSVFGVGVASFYYARKYWKYGKFEKNMRRKPGGRGYWRDPTDAADEAKAKGVEKLDRSLKVEVDQDQADVWRGSVGKDPTPRWDEAELYGGFSGTERSGLGGVSEELGGFMRPQRAVTLPEPAASFASNHFTKNGVGSIWSTDKFKSGYDGRKIRKKAWDEDMEMSAR
ncbi:uncharacterized protein K460DRAFT_402741 [Cucurbitaria berberidis CBS 394.84]|uniref:Transmembrane protein n=1 Tax=Cucurbitaria berberidis CBS 394.84 TaxID=1168544 RepID=A0A9P4GL76_9PLEO|nr:uncharacterized protein K460DRAFT_402741 [Cucurbitaria berberidis CBS 394.84]KAF1847381.1 hypothetical protein K460DRAFT_402741 [Cucurbitaria berberidis CBS 394.84]